VRLLDSLEEWLIAFLIGAATLITCAAVIHRHLSGYAIPGLQDALLRIDMGWAQELTVIMFVWLAKFGAAYGVRTGIHVGVDVLVNKLGERNRRRCVLFSLAAGAFFTAVVATLGARLVWGIGFKYVLLNLLHIANTESEGPRTADLDWPKWIVYAAVPLGSSLMCFRFLQALRLFAKTGELARHHEGHVEGLDIRAPAPATATPGGQTP
jgi:C4-dicarboxylate transporter DctQ subunit